MVGRVTSPCAGPDPAAFGSLDDDARQRVLAAQAALFATTFGRWSDRRAGDGLSYAKLRLLETLHREGPTIMRELGDELAVSPRTMTALVDSLEEAGLVARRPHPSDRRATLVELRPDAAAGTNRLCQHGSDAVADLFGELSLTEQRHLYRALRTLLEAMLEG
jgi:DNA-binding MarR family transcriptional regulator